MDAPFGKILEITSINSKTLIANDEWKMGFIENAPLGWKPKDRIRLSEVPKLGTKPGSGSGASTARVQVENLDKKGQILILYFEGSISMEKSLESTSEGQPSLKENIRLDRELTIIETYPDYVIRVTGSTKWQLYKESGSYRELNWSKDDKVKISKTIVRPNEDSQKYFIENMDEKQKLLAIFMSEA